jgi:hypothetical protein
VHSCSALEVVEGSDVFQEEAHEFARLSVPHVPRAPTPVADRPTDPAELTDSCVSYRLLLFVRPQGLLVVIMAELDVWSGGIGSIALPRLQVTGEPRTV